MFTKNRQCFQVVLAGILIPAIAHILPVPSRGEDLPAQVVRDLKDNTAAVNRLTISWEQSRSSRLALDELLEFIKAPGRRAFFHTEYKTVIYQEGKLSCNTKYTQWIDGKFIKVNHDCAFDGKLLYVGDSTDLIPSVIIRDLGNLAAYNTEYYVYYCEYLEAAGFKVHNRHGTIHRAPESDLLYLIGHGGQISSVRDVPV